MTKEEYILLYEKFLAGLCTRQEIERLEAYQDDFSLESDIWDSNILGDEQTAAERMYVKLQGDLKSTEPTRFFQLRWIRFAAAAVFFLVAGSFLYTAFNSKIEPTTVSAKTAISPGGKMATLTLQDGSKVVLDHSAKGIVARQGGMLISKNRDGQVIYHNSGDSDRNGPSAFTNDNYNTITTPRGGEYELLLSDNTRVWLNAESSLKFPAVFNGSERKVELIGEAYFEVARNAKMPFKVISDGNEVEVLGTHFNINAYPGRPVSTVLAEGSVRLKNGVKETLLKPGQEGVSIKGGSLTVKKANVADALAWKNGYFVFQDEHIYSIMEKVSRWYDVDVAYQGKMDGLGFFAKVDRYEHITELLNNLQTTGTVKFKIQGRRITVMPK